MNFVMKEILVQSDLVSVLLNVNYSQLNIYIKHLQTLVYISKYYKFNANIYNTVNIPIKQFLRHFCEY